MYLISGLGNPGRTYSRNRHNAGFMLLDRMAGAARQQFEQLGCHSLGCVLERAGQHVLLAKPQTYMNRSGQAIREIIENRPVELSQMLVIYDDLALPLGKIRLRKSGGAGGHKGMGSIIGALETENVPRLRIGILRDESPGDYSTYVLDNFTKEELKILDEILDLAIQAVETAVTDGLEKAMSLYN